MTRDRIEREKKRLAITKPVLDTDVLRYQQEMREWDEKFTALQKEEERLVNIELGQSFEMMGRIANIEKMVANRLWTIECEHNECLRVQLDRRYNKKTKREVKATSIHKIVFELEVQIMQLEAEREVLISRLLDKM